MDKQTIADELARLAGWSTDGEVWSRYGKKSGGRHYQRKHPFPVGSLDALEAFRRERLPGWELWAIEMSTKWYRAVYRTTDRASHVDGAGPDEWTARASALVAAAKENP
jgi:hypothetical protein